MSSEIAVKVENLGKCYSIYDTPRDRLKQFVVPHLQRFAGRIPKQYFREFWALRDVSFEVRKGETVGIIGRNGSGKSTLLQLICGTLYPTSGSIQTHGRIAALLELGSGFNPEFTGRENVYMNAAVLGLSNKEIGERFDDIAAFADIGDFIEQPVKTYSSGMVVRLAFSVAINVDPEILVVDEALAVGDMNFQAKCMTALSRIQERGATILFVTHDVGVIKSLCSRAMYLEQGMVHAIGKAADVAEQYIRFMREEMNEENRRFVRVSAPLSDKKNDSSDNLKVETDNAFKSSDDFNNRVAMFRYGTGEAKIAMVELLDINEEPIRMIEFDQEVKIRIYFEVYTEKSISVNVYIFDDKKNNITGCNFHQMDQSLMLGKPGEKFMAEYIFRLPLQEGNYSLGVQITSPIIRNESAEFLDVVNDAVIFKVNRWERARVWSKVHLFPQLKIKHWGDQIV